MEINIYNIYSHTHVADLAYYLEQVLPRFSYVHIGNEHERANVHANTNALHKK